MKILVIADTELTELWDHWQASGRERLKGVDLILSAGDLAPEYLEYLVTMTNVPLLYVRGNHDDRYENDPPQGCICIEDQLAEIIYNKETGSLRVLLPGDRGYISNWRKKAIGDRRNGNEIFIAAGLGGSAKYREGSNMYTEEEMAGRMSRLIKLMKTTHFKAVLAHRVIKTSEFEYAGRRTKAVPHLLPLPSVDILLTHAPCRGYGDMEDLPHRGFECFNEFLERFTPEYHCYGHIHMNYQRVARIMDHPSGTKLINSYGMYIIEI